MTTTPPSPKLPSGTVTFLFSDIEGSTLLLRRLGAESYAEVLADHHRIIRSALESYKGTEVSTQGDGFFAVFSSSTACTVSVIEMQRALASHEWPEGEAIRVRMGMHSGEAIEVSTGLVGLDVHKAARVAASAHGGQVLLSESLESLVRDLLPDGTSLRDLGLHRLKDLGRPERIYQLDIEGLPGDFPPIRSLDNPELENNLPAQLSSFVGRDTELKEIGGLVESSRLVTLTGSGGTGKTRLALHVAAELLDGSGEGVWFVDLAPVADPGLVASTVAQAIGVREQPGSSVAETLVDAIGDRRLLIVLDNCEHLIDSCAKLTDALLRSCPGIHVLATSREPLAISGERVYRVPPLRLPGPEDDVLTVGDSEAVRLFLERAFGHVAHFTLDDRNAKAMASICRHLDGIPLAIELAAARVVSMDVSDIEARLDQRFSLLTKGSRSALPRQQTLRALVDWSYELLTDLERSTLSRLSVFAGGWDLAAAEAVAATEDTEVFAIVDVLGSLVDKSLVQADSTSVGLRYRLLETIRQFATEKLAERDDARLDALAAHARFFLELAERAAPELRGPRQAEWLERLEADHDNLRSAIEKFLADPRGGAHPNEGSGVLRIVVALSRFFKARYPREGVELFTAALANSATEHPTALKAEAFGVLGDIMEGRDRRRYLEEGLAMARSFGDPVLVAELLTWLCWCAFQEDDLIGCDKLVEEAVTIARSVGDPGLLGRALTRKASARSWADGIGVSDSGFEEAIRLLRLAGDHSWEAIALCNLATFETYLQDFESSEAHYSEALILVEELGNTPGVNTILGNIGSMALLKGDFVRAKELLLRGLRGAHREGERRSCVYLILNIAECLSRSGDEKETAAQLYGAADAQNEEQLDLPWEPDNFEEREGEQSRLRQSMGERAFDSAYRQGRELTFDAAVALALEAAS